MAMMQQKIIPWRSNLGTGLIGAAPNPAIAKIVIPAKEMITIQMVSKTKTIPPDQASSRPSGRMGKLALRNRQQMENQRMTITCPTPKMK